MSHLKLVWALGIQAFSDERGRPRQRVLDESWGWSRSGVVAQAVGIALTFDHVAAVEHAVEQGNSKHRITEDGSPLLEAFVGSEHR